MVLLTERLGRSLRFPSRMENHQHHHHLNSETALYASFEGFRSYVSKILNQLLPSSNPGLEFMSLAWVDHHCFQTLVLVNKALAKLALDIDYPMSKWESTSTEEYLSYSLNLLDLLNSITSTISNLGQARLELSHAVSLADDSPSSAVAHLRKIQLKGPAGKKLNLQGKRKTDEGSFSGNGGKEGIIYQALLILRSIGLWVSGVVLSGLCSAVEPYTQMRKAAAGFDDSLLKNLDSIVCKVFTEKRGVMKEVEMVENSAASLAAAIAAGRGNAFAKEMRSRLEVLEKLLQSIEKDTQHMFAEILAARNKLLDCLRHKGYSKSV